MNAARCRVKSRAKTKPSGPGTQKIAIKPYAIRRGPKLGTNGSIAVCLEESLSLTHAGSQGHHAVERASSRGALNSFLAELVEGHIRYHMSDPDRRPASKEARAAQELIDVVKSYVK
jgi:hypothetical protein